MNILLYLAVLVVACIIWNAVIKKGLNKVGCNRYFSKPAVFEGEKGELIEILHNDKPFMIPWLRVESHISPSIQLGNQDNLHVSESAYYCSLFTLMPYQQVKRTHHVKFLRRGYFDLGNASLTAGDLLGFTRFHRTQELSAPVLVYPRLMDENEFPTPLSQLLEDLVQRQQLQQDPFSVRGIRPYLPGDPVRDIHWAATARTGETHVKVHDYSARTRLLVIMNVQYDDLQIGNVIPEKYYDVLEQGISMAATLCVRAIRNGFTCGLAANMPVVGSKDSVFVAPDGNAHEEELLATFARLQLDNTEKMPVLLEKLKDQTGLDIVIISLYDSSSIQAGMQELRRCGNQVTLHLLEGGAQ